MPSPVLVAVLVATVSTVAVSVPVVVRTGVVATMGRCGCGRTDAVHGSDDGVDGRVGTARERARDGGEERGVEHREELRGAADEGLRGDGGRGGVHAEQGRVAREEALRHGGDERVHAERAEHRRDLVRAQRQHPRRPRAQARVHQRVQPLQRHVLHRPHKRLQPGPHAKRSCEMLSVLCVLKGVVKSREKKENGPV